MNYIADQIPDNASVLEIGPGHVPFKRATHWVDFQNIQPNTTKVDLSSEVLPFGDDEFDFIYCRHVLEDMYNPVLLLKEMSRVGKSGYIETPSPIAELSRGVDGGSPPYRGYHHHRWVLWVHQGEFRFTTKYPFAEYLTFEEERSLSWLRQGPKYWNTYYLWKDKINWVHRQNALDYSLPTDLRSLMNDALLQSVSASDDFWTNIPRNEIAA